MASKTVMDYGFRGALYDLSEFEDYEEVLKSFSPEAAVPFQFGRQPICAAGNLHLQSDVLPQGYSE